MTATWRSGPETASACLIVSKAGDADSARVASQMAAALGPVERIAGLPKELIPYTYAGAQELLATCRAKHIAIVYLAPGLSHEVTAIAAALNDQSLLTLAAMANDVAPCRRRRRRPAGGPSQAALEPGASRRHSMSSSSPRSSSS